MTTYKHLSRGLNVYFNKFWGKKGNMVGEENKICDRGSKRKEKEQGKRKNQCKVKYVQPSFLLLISFHINFRLL